MSPRVRKRVAALTAEFGGEDALRHAERLIRIVETIADGAEYDREAIWLAAHMHDWGTFPRWSREEVSHSQRSRDLAAEELRKLKCPAATMALVLEAIEYHHGGADERSIEAILLRDADALDGMGATGVLREFAAIPTESAGCYTVPTGWGLRGAYDRAVIRMENNPRMLRMAKSKAIARKKERAMRSILDAFERESYGCF